MTESVFDPGSPFAHLEPVETSFWYSYMKVLLRVRYEMNRQLRATSGISISDYDVLIALTSENDGRMSVTDLAIRIGWERSRLSHHIVRMRKGGLLTTERSSTDARTTEVILASQGRDTIAEATPSHIAFIRAAFLDVLSPDELTRMHDSFDRVYDALIAHGSLPRPADHP